MKIILVMVTAVALGSCYSSKKEQVEMVNAQLIKIDTIFRYQSLRNQYAWQEEQQLTWKDNNNKEYVSFASINQTYTIGTRMTMLFRIMVMYCS